MSANNMITINKRTFEVKEIDADTETGRAVGKGKTLEEAIEIADREIKKEYIEYGIHFV